MNTKFDYQYNPGDAIDGAVAPAKQFCMGYLNPGASGMGYIATLKLSVGSVSVENLDEVTEEIVSYDRCEKNDAYIGQINMLTASSFCGLNGAVWGYDLAVADAIKSGELEPMYYQSQPDGPDIPVYPVYPLLDATQRLFGIASQLRFPPMPGAHVACANKDVTAKGETWIWSAIALAILQDRSSGANLFVEDAGTHPGSKVSYGEINGFLLDTQRKITYSVALCGQDQGVTYKEIFVGYKMLYVPEGCVGSALTCAPYILLAQNAIPEGEPASSLMDMTISQWEQVIGLPDLPETSELSK
jgi:histidine decarboxylase